MNSSSAFRSISFSFLFCMLYTIAYTQVIPAHRKTAWHLSGLTATYQEPLTCIDFTQNGGVSDGVTPNDAALSALLNTLLAGDSLCVYFPDGEYLFTQKIKLKSNVFLKGQSRDATIFKLNMNTAQDAIEFAGSQTNDTTFLQATAFKDSAYFSVFNPGIFSVGDMVYVSDNDSSLVTSGWALGSTGQLIEIIQIMGNVLHVKSPLRRDFFIQQKPYVRKLNMLQNAGIENVTLLRMDSTASQTDNIHLLYARNIRLSCLKSLKCNFSHIGVRYSSNILVNNSYFSESFGYGGGGRAYGVMLHFGTGECLIAENHFNYLRHAMILQAGANGNVFAYNYSRNPFWTGTGLPSNSAGDMVLHGNYAYMNLFEGNIGQHMVIDDSHGSNGPYNTFFRNRAELYGFFMNSGTPTDKQNIVGNEITNMNFPYGLYMLSGVDHIEYGNNVKGTIMPGGTTNLSDSSLFLSIVPAFYTSNAAWPPIGIPNTLGQHPNRIFYMHTQGELPACNSEITVLPEVQRKVGQLILYPNPAQTHLHVSISKEPMENLYCTIYSYQGKVVLQQADITNNTHTIDVSHLPAGIYVLRLKDNYGVLHTGRFCKF